MTPGTIRRGTVVAPQNIAPRTFGEAIFPEDKQRLLLIATEERPIEAKEILSPVNEIEFTG